MPYPYSSVTHPVTTSTTDFSYSTIDLLDNVPVKDQLTVYKDGQLITYGNAANQYQLNLTTEYVVLNTAISTGSIKIARVTDIENKEVTFTNSSVLTAQDLNKNSDQLLFLAQELYDKAQDISLTPVGSIADDSIGSNLLNKNAGAEAVVTTAIRDLAVQTAKIDDLAVTAAKIGNDAIETTKILDGAVTTDKILDLNVTTGKINDLAVTTGKINDGAVTSVKLATSFYDTGTFTPSYILVSPAGTLRTSSWTYSTNTGFWTRIGKLLYINLNLVTTAGTIGTGVNGDFVEITGLPTGFTLSSLAPALVGTAYNFVSAAPRSGIWFPSTNTIRLYTISASPAFQSSSLIRQNMSFTTASDQNHLEIMALATIV